MTHFKHQQIAMHRIEFRSKIMSNDLAALDEILERKTYTPDDLTYSFHINDSCVHCKLSTTQFLISKLKNKKSIDVDSMLYACQKGNIKHVLMLSEYGLRLPVNEAYTLYFKSMLARNDTDVEVFLDRLSPVNESLLEMSYSILCMQKNRSPLSYLSTASEWHKPSLLQLSSK